jgi:hypothetical protein
MVREQEFHRIVTNIGQGAATYDALVRATLSILRL